MTRANFRLDHLTGAPEPSLGVFGEGVVLRPDENLYFTPPGRVRRPSPLDLLIPLRRMVNHTAYWDAVDPRARTCFEQVVVEAGWDVGGRPELALAAQA